MEDASHSQLRLMGSGSVGRGIQTESKAEPNFVYFDLNSKATPAAKLMTPAHHQRIEQSAEYGTAENNRGQSRSRSSARKTWVLS